MASRSWGRGGGRAECTFALILLLTPPRPAPPPPPPDFGHPDFTIYNGGAFPANRYTSYMTSSTSIDVSLKHKEMVRAAE